MTEKQILILDKYSWGKISRDNFLHEFGEAIEDVEFIKEELKKSIESKNEDHIERAIRLMWFQKNSEPFIDELNLLLLVSNHRSHQVITKTIQGLRNPKSIPFIRKALESNFDYLEYTCSDSDVIAKWFSWALYSIGTTEAINIIKEYTKSENQGIRNEMIYRLNKVKK
jgi:hypothetical protein